MTVIDAIKSETGESEIIVDHTNQTYRVVGYDDNDLPTVRGYRPNTSDPP